MLRGGRGLAALIAMVAAAAVTTAMLNLYVDVQAKLRKEFRNYGANVVVVSKDGRPLPDGSLETVRATLGARGLAVPFSYVIAQTADGHPVVVAGTDFDQVRKLDGWWSVTAWPSGAGEALIGARAQAALDEHGQALELKFQGKSLRVTPTGILRTGSSEDSRIYIRLKDFEDWTGVAPLTIEIAASGTPKEVADDVQRLAAALPAAEVRPIRQIMEGEANVLGKTRSTIYVTAVLIILTAALCVLATLIGWVFDRRVDFAIMKALGASERLIGGFFAAEAAALGFAGAVIGFLLGIGIADWIGQANFHATVSPRFELFPAIAIGSVTVSLLAAVVPISLLRRVEPSIILRGE